MQWVSEWLKDGEHLACPQGASLRSVAQGMAERVALLKGAVFVGPLGAVCYPGLSSPFPPFSG